MKNTILLLIMLSFQTSLHAKTIIEGYLPEYNERTQIYVPAKRWVTIEGNKIVNVSEKPPQQILKSDKVITERKYGRMLISPGFVDMHSHLEYNYIPLWPEANGQFTNRFEWRDTKSYSDFVKLNKSAFDSNDFEERTFNRCLVSKFAEIKALLGGATSVQGAGAGTNCLINYLTKNVENAAEYESNFSNRNITNLFAPNQIFPDMVNTVFPHMIANNTSFENSFKVLSQQTPAIPFSRDFKYFIDDFNKYLSIDKSRVSSFIVHLAEGSRLDKYNALEYKVAKAIGYTKQNLIIIHGIGLDSEDLENAKNSTFVWSPLSNLILYGETLNIPQMLAKNINVTLGADWSPSGSKNILEELKFAKKYLSLYEPQSQISDKQLVDMITINAAKALNLQDKIGKISSNYLADITLIKMKSGREDFYTQITQSHQNDIQGVFINGKITYGGRHLVEFVADESSIVESFSDLDLNAACYWTRFKSLAVPKSDTELVKYSDITKAMNKKLSDLKLKTLNLEKQKSILDEVDSPFACSNIKLTQKIDYFLKVTLKQIKERKLRSGRPHLTNPLNITPEDQKFFDLESLLKEIPQ